MSEPMTPEGLAEIRERSARATPGPWEASGPLGRTRRVWAPNSLTPHLSVADGMFGRDAAFVVHAIEDVPDLLAELKTLRAAAEEADEYGDRAVKLLHGARAEVDQLRAQVDRSLAVLTNPTMDAGERLVAARRELRAALASGDEVS